ncbi:cobyrinate a,c-diamide synthase [uncultured Nocardioides sp.]|uniref:cobyrinate a,c-diamide synthase n=1 Tax=uncultured Nocardioides sp. TaxID=198441 RepID=UPI00260BEE1F|nr:cobyrinate a,c-diamide synthase [uncultured Nocardioides sp.]
MTLPRIVIAAPGTGQGKTTVATGLMAALRARGMTISGHKVGPDYIDPGYHAVACGRPGRNLDPHLVGERRIGPLFLHGVHTPVTADLAVIEGVMGLFDGRVGTEGFASTAHVARLTRSPVVLVVDISRSSRTVGAVVHGLETYEPGIEVAAVVLNRAGSPRHAAEVISALRLPVLGVIPRDDRLATPSRHLGLVPAAEQDQAEAVVDAWRVAIAEHVNLDAVVEVARTAPDLIETPWSATAEVRPVSGSPIVAMAGGRAFTFRYAETEELLRAAGCQVAVFDPMVDPHLPDGTAAIYLGGGFPEVHAPALTDNVMLRRELAAAVADGVPTVAECAGLLYLCSTLDSSPMVGSIDAAATMTERLTLRYPTMTATTDNLLSRAGELSTGHEFHRTQTQPERGAVAAWTVEGRDVGFAGPTIHASYLHTHWAGHPAMAQRFAQAASRHGRPWPTMTDHG